MQKIVLNHSQHALFLDFDGTLADIAPVPSAVKLHTGLVGTLGKLHAALNGALAMVSGRSLPELDRFLAPLVLPAAAEHGMQWRQDHGHFFEIDAQPLAAKLKPLQDAAQYLVRNYPSLLLEIKTAGFALHYRMAPALYNLCWQTLAPLVHNTPSLTILRGKYVLEVMPSRVDKGMAIRNFMQRTPFAGRTPIFVGDDLTDEAGFAEVQSHAGHGVKVGAGPSLAHHRCPNPAALRAWLVQGLVATAYAA